LLIARPSIYNNRAEEPISSMATASPTPLGSSHFSQLNRRPSSRQTLRQPPARPHLNRGGPLPVSAGGPATADSRQYSLNDSSDDEIPMPMKFSALTKALLNDDASILPPSSPSKGHNNLSGSTAADDIVKRHVRGSSVGLGDVRVREKKASPGARANSPLPRRVVRLSGTPVAQTLKRTTSLQSSVRKCNEQTATKGESPLDISTPAHAVRTVRIPITSSVKHRLSVGSSGKASNGTSSGPRSGNEDSDMPEDPATIARTQLAISHGSVSRFGSSTIGRGNRGEETGLRVKRLGKVAGSFLSGPARRGRRRQSEDEEEPSQANEEGLDGAFSSQEPQSQGSEGLEIEIGSSQESQLSHAPFYASQHVDFASGSPVSTTIAPKPLQSISPVSINQPAPLAPVAELEKKGSPIRAQPVFRLPAPRPELPSSHDQENEAPPTFRRNKPVSFVHLDKMEKVAVRPEAGDLSVMRATSSPERRPLAPRNQNTPRRAAPPPPKMSVLETATATAGAATTSHANKKRNNIRVNGKIFTRMEIVGRGGSSKVWRVMAENGKVFALKRVSLEDADENAVRGYKGEIDLLKKLEGNDRVVRLLDYEMNDEKQTLSVVSLKLVSCMSDANNTQLMEMGELDFNKVLTLRFNAEDAKFDPSFTRHYWKEMLECIQAVHDHDIVHSDLKPANFVLVQGRLKLIDFGIANAIQTDETVNVHRDTQIGTPNYMSPESLMDANEIPGAKGMISGQPKVMKLGKPSDIWSLGCILYQMAYGRQPFAHIQNQMSRCRAIIDFNYAIEFPVAGVGGVVLPKSLLRTMKKCLNRNQHQRPSAKELLDERDPFLNPVECDEGAIPMTEELLGRILQNVVSKCKERTPSDAELLSLWPQGYFASLRKGLKE
jgi:serine/threonine-protein kinase TTK/MPS1